MHTPESAGRDGHQTLCFYAIDPTKNRGPVQEVITFSSVVIQNLSRSFDQPNRSHPEEVLERLNVFIQSETVQEVCGCATQATGARIAPVA
jgi:hypothetical protein